MFYTFLHNKLKTVFFIFLKRTSLSIILVISKPKMVGGVQLFLQ